MINDDDPTQSLPDTDKTTQPTVNAILERMQGFEARISQLVESQSASVRKEVAVLGEEMTTQNASLREEMTTQNGSLREEMTAQFLGVNAQIRTLANKIDVLNEDGLTLRASQRDLLKRMAEIESNAS